jgi:predicted glutamine amidotransferase
MDCNTPTDIVFSFTGLARRGGATGPHGDGWGLAFFEGPAARVFLDPHPCALSPLSSFLREHPIQTLQAIAHIRKKTRGRVRLANTHPFARELWGRHWVFAHNGTVKGAKELPLSGRFTPVGQTDSEHAFCWLLEQIALAFKRPPEDKKKLWALIAKRAGTLAELGTFNFILGDGEHLYARCDTRLWHIVRKAPFGQASLKDDDVTVNFSEVTTPRDRVAVVATAPLTTNERWTRGQPATMWVFRKGALLATLPSGTPSKKALRILANEGAPGGAHATSSEPCTIAG